MTAPQTEKEENDRLLETSYPSEATIGDQARRGITPFPKARPFPIAQLIARNPAIRERIAGRAYDLYAQRGRAPGHDVEDWLKAEQMVLDELTLRAFGKTAKGFRARFERKEKA